MSPPLHDIHVGDPPVLLQKRRGFGWLGLLAGLVVIAGVSGLLWINYDRLIAASSPTSTSAQVSETAAAETEPAPSAADLQALQQQTTQAWQSTSQLVEAQSAELKRLTDQVAALTARIDQLQQAPTTATTPPRADQPRPAAVTAPPRPPVPPRTAAPRRQPAAAPRPGSSISLGGAPLPGAPPASVR